jgi:hypothetical protein
MDLERRIASLFSKERNLADVFMTLNNLAM